MERVGGDHRGRDSRTRQSARQNQTRIAGRHYRYQEQHNRLCDRAGGISRSSRAHVRETPALRYLSWGVRGDHGVLVIATMTDANRPKRDTSNRIRMRQSELGSTAHSDGSSGLADGTYYTSWIRQLVVCFDSCGKDWMDRS